MTSFQLPVMVCERCNYRWTPRVANPKRCPACLWRFKTPEVTAVDSGTGQ